MLNCPYTLTIAIVVPSSFMETRKFFTCTSAQYVYLLDICRMSDVYESSKKIGRWKANNE